MGGLRRRRSPGRRRVTAADDRLLPEGGLIAGGVTTTTALGLSAVWRSLDILANGVSQLEWSERLGNLDLPPSRLVVRPQAQRTRREWTSLVVSTLALYDVCYLLKIPPYDADGKPMALWPIDPTIIAPILTDVWSLVPPTRFRILGREVSIDDLEILRRSPQPTIFDTTGGVIQLARTTFAAALAAERYASRYWQAGGAPTTVLEAEATIGETDADKMSERWASRRAKGPDYAPVLSGGLKAKPFGADPTNESAVVARRELVADIGRYFGIGSSLLNSPNQSSETYSTTEAEGIHLVRYTLQNYVGAIQDAVSEQLPAGHRMVMDVSRLTRGVQNARAQSWQLALAGGAWMTPQEVRDEEGLPPLEDPSQLKPAVVAAPVGGPPNG
jgi:HK97 family phage portal protein